MEGRNGQREVMEYLILVGVLGNPSGNGKEMGVLLNHTDKTESNNSVGRGERW